MLQMGDAMRLLPNTEKDARRTAGTLRGAAVVKDAGRQTATGQAEGALGGSTTVKDTGRSAEGGLGGAAAAARRVEGALDAGRAESGGEVRKLSTEGRLGGATAAAGRVVGA